MAQKEEKILKWTTVIATIATSVLAATALITVYITLSGWQAQREASRPYLTFKETPKVALNEHLSFDLRFVNVGTHPAINLWSKTLVFEQGLTQNPVHIDEYTLVNDIPKDSSSALIIDIEKKDVNPEQENINPYYIVISLEYGDPIIDKTYSQTIFVKWNGKTKGEEQSIVHVEAKERDRILNYLDQQKIGLTRGSKQRWSLKKA